MSNGPLQEHSRFTPSEDEEEKDLAELLNMNISQIKELDVEALREIQLQGVYVIEAALFKQAGSEYLRLHKTREHVAKLTENLISRCDTMEDSEKIELLKVISKNQQESLKFLNTLHNNVASGMEVADRIESIKSKRSLGEGNLTELTEKSKQKISEVRSAIQNQIQKRIKDRKKGKL